MSAAGGGEVGDAPEASGSRLAQRCRPFRVVPYEVTCESEHVCAQATTALYVSASLLNNPDELFSAVEFATGLATLVYPQSEGPRDKKP